MSQQFPLMNYDQLLAFVKPRLAVVIPCYRVSQQIEDVLDRIGDEVELIVVVDDCCPENTGQYVENNMSDRRIVVIKHDHNQGVGAAFLTGLRKALEVGCDIVLKIDGDGQMDPELIPAFVTPIIAGRADFTKGNRFYDLNAAMSMPFVRKVGNVALSFMTKLSSGYWHLFDPTNGYFAIHRTVALKVLKNPVSQRYFFESDLLFHLNFNGAVACDIPMESVYKGERSSLVIRKILGEFIIKNAINTYRRIKYTYFVRDFGIESIQLVSGFLLCLFSLCFGSWKWGLSIVTGVTASAGSVMLAALPLLLGVTFIIAFINFDVSRRHTIPLFQRSLDLKAMTGSNQHDKAV